MAMSAPQVHKHHTSARHVADGYSHIFAKREMSQVSGAPKRTPGQHRAFSRYLGISKNQLL
jgi:hypothetical protein